jgi:hypothetical protein
MTTPPESGQEPADLSELTATDAMLDRLGARAATNDDLLDPAAAALADLVATIDQSREPDADAARLIEVLAGRPLYIAGAEPAADQTALIIDLTEHEDDPSDQHGSGSGRSETLVPGTRLPSTGVIPIRIPAPEPVGARRWDRVLSQVSLPAAAVLLLLAVGGGVSAAVTGNPMTPVNGISRVMAQLPGVQDSSLDKVKTEISAAEQAARKSDVPAANMHLRNARAGLSDVPEAEKTHLANMINQVAILVPTTPVTDPGGTTGSGPGTSPVEQTAAPTANPPASADPTATATVEPSVEPTSDPGSTDVPSTPDTVPTTEAPPEDETPAPSTASP